MKFSIIREDEKDGPYERNELFGRLNEGRIAVSDHVIADNDVNVIDVKAALFAEGKLFGFKHVDARQTAAGRSAPARIILREPRERVSGRHNSSEPVNHQDAKKWI